MYYTTDIFGQVAFKDLANPTGLPKGLSRKEAAAQIISDLKAVIGDLDAAGGGNTGTATKEAANFLLAKVYLNNAVFSQDPTNPAGPFTFAKADMDAVIASADAIITGGKYSVTPNYFDNFHWENTARSKELIFVTHNGPTTYYMNADNKFSRSC